ncbi:cell division protein FtsL [Azohydromonas caseinilytica]|uniref:Cell division protein FtsL n=1 Tax=Azohydromonas caseinilytica TaxID=2728836 RepID=A0A848FGU2_9BURK|nr:cell division protein FtsL [Azohydromonas caseinilytica]NML18482.1 cell division protein FtsL [Azohydromonas caseinilytica]
MTRLNVLLLIALVGSCMYLVKIAYEGRQLYTALDRARNEERLLERDFKRLQAEREAQATSGRVEKVARERLAMRTATPAVTFYVDAAASEAQR